MVHFILFPLRHFTLDDRVRAFISMMNPNIDGVESLTTLGLAGTYGFSVLEGLLNRYLEDLDDSGTISDLSDIDIHWISDDSPGFRAKLMLWKSENEASLECVKQVLKEVDNLERDEYNLSEANRRTYLQQRFEFDENKWDNISEDERNSFYWILQEGRRHNIHGIRGIQSIAPIVLNLCCLTFLDMITEEEYIEAKEELLDYNINRSRLISSQSTHKISPDWNPNQPLFRADQIPGTNATDSPAVFYPVFDDTYEAIRRARYED